MWVWKSGFCCCDQNAWWEQLRGGKAYFGSQFQKSKSMLTSFTALSLKWGRALWQKGVAQESYLLHGNWEVKGERERRGEDWRGEHSRDWEEDKSFRVCPSDLLPASRSHLSVGHPAVRWITPLMMSESPWSNHRLKAPPLNFATLGTISFNTWALGDILYSNHNRELDPIHVHLISATFGFLIWKMKILTLIKTWVAIWTEQGSVCKVLNPM